LFLFFHFLLINYYYILLYLFFFNCNRDRSSYEEQLVNTDLNEFVMYDSQGNLYEGLSSNFYIYYKNSIYTAPEDVVLEGTTGKMVFKGCKEMNIPVKREFPNINNIKEWSGAFITSKFIK